MITISQLEFQFPQSDFRLVVPALEIKHGERVAIVGPSGSGKTTLLRLFAGILTPSSGTIRVQNCDMHSLSDSARRRMRIAKLGLVFQDIDLVCYLNVLENILLPYRLNPALRLTPEIKNRAKQLADETGIAHRLCHLPHCLSHGEKQRVAICRAMLPEPPLLLADEPTGNLDPIAKQHIVDLLFQQVDRTAATLVFVTHDTEIASRFPRVINSSEFSKEGSR